MQRSLSRQDGVGTPPGTCLTANIDHSTFRYNVQDGLDLGHIDTGKCSMKITNSTAYGNNGGTFKWGPNENPAILINNVVIANCARMSAPIQGAAPAYNAHLGDFCRAGDAVSFNFRQGGLAFFANNTFVTYAPGTFDTQCWDAPGVGSGSINTGCGNSTLVFKNNIVLGYDNPKTYDLDGKPGGPAFFLRPQEPALPNRPSQRALRESEVRLPAPLLKRTGSGQLQRSSLRYQSSTRHRRPHPRSADRLLR